MRKRWLAFVIVLGQALTANAEPSATGGDFIVFDLRRDREGALECSVNGRPCSGPGQSVGSKVMATLHELYAYRPKIVAICLGPGATLGDGQDARLASEKAGFMSTQLFGIDEAGTFVWRIHYGDGFKVHYGNDGTSSQLIAPE